MILGLNEIIALSFAAAKGKSLKGSEARAKHIKSLFKNGGSFGLDYWDSVLNILKELQQMEGVNLEALAELELWWRSE